MIANTASSRRDHSGRVAKRMSLPGRASPPGLFFGFFRFLLKCPPLHGRGQDQFSRSAKRVIQRSIEASSCVTFAVFCRCRLCHRLDAPKFTRLPMRWNIAHSPPTLWSRKTFLSINVAICCCVSTQSLGRVLRVTNFSRSAALEFSGVALSLRAAGVRISARAPAELPVVQAE